LCAAAGLAAGGPQTAAFYQGKLKTCDYFCRYELPKVDAWVRVLQDADTTTLEMAQDWF